MPDLDLFSDLPVAAPVLAPSGQVAPRVLFLAAPHLASDMALGAGREGVESAPIGVADWHA